MYYAFAFVTGAFGATQLYQTSFHRLKSITPADSAAKMWLTKQAELVLLRLANTEGLTERTFDAFEDFLTSTMKHPSEDRIQEVALLIERVRRELDSQANKYDSHEFFMMTLALQLYNDIDVNIFERFPGLLVSDERQKILIRLVVKLQAHGIAQSGGLIIGTCRSSRELVQRILNLDTDELDLYTSGLETVEQGMNKLTRASGADVRFTYIPNSLAFIYCAPPLVPSDKVARLERLRMVANSAKSATLDAIAVDWARTVKESALITERYDDQRDVYWVPPDMALRNLRSFSLCLLARHVLRDADATMWTISIKKFLDAYILVDAYLKNNPETPLVEVGNRGIVWANRSLGIIIETITRGPRFHNTLEANDRLMGIVHNFKTGYSIDAGVAVTSMAARIPPIPSVHASQIRIHHTLNLLTVKFPAAETYLRGIATLMHQYPFAPKTHLYSLEGYLRSLEMPAGPVAAPERARWDLEGTCDLSRRFGMELIKFISTDPETIRVTSHVCELAKKFPGYPSGWLGGNDPWLRHVSPILSQHWRAMREFQKRPFGIGETVTGFLPGALMAGLKDGPRTFVPLVSWYYSHKSALCGGEALRGLSVNDVQIPQDIITKIARMSDPAHMFGPLVQFYEELYRNNYNNPTARLLVDTAICLLKEAFSTFVMLKNAPEPHQAAAGAYMESIWLLLKEFARGVELAVTGADTNRLIVNALNNVAGSFAVDLKRTRWNLPFPDSSHSREILIWDGVTPASTKNPRDSFITFVRKVWDNSQDYIETINKAQMGTPA